MDPYPTADIFAGAPGTIAPADGNYAPAALHNLVSADSSDATGTMGLNGLLDAQEENRRDGKPPLVGARHAVPVPGKFVDLGPNNERLEDVKPELVNALR